VTPHQYITAIITERGVFRAPFTESLASAFTPPQEPQEQEASAPA